MNRFGNLELRARDYQTPKSKWSGGRWARGQSLLTLITLDNAQRERERERERERDFFAVDLHISEGVQGRPLSH